MEPYSNETIWYQWRKDGGEVGEETESGVMFIPSIKRTDAGNYTCRGSNIAGYSDSVFVTILVHCKYSFVVPTSSLAPIIMKTFNRRFLNIINYS